MGLNAGEFGSRLTDRYRQIVPERTLETVARSFHKEGLSYGFSELDFVRFVNLLLDRVMQRGAAAALQADRRQDGNQMALEGFPSSGPTELPCRTHRLELRPLALPADLDHFRHWLSDPYGRHFLLSCASARYEYIEDLLARDDSKFAIISLLDGGPIGAVGFLHHDTLQKKAELRKLIGEPAARGKGYAKEGTRLWIRYGFRVLGLRKIYLDTLDTNLRNIQLNESLGFTVEGILRNEITLEEGIHDVLRMGLCLDAHRI